MSEIDAKAIVEGVATQVRDPISGRSVWLAEMVRLGEVQEDLLHFGVPAATGDDALAGAFAELAAHVAQKLPVAS